MVLIEELDAADVQGKPEQHVYNQMGQKKLPVMVLTGYLGAGKTTLLNYILKEQSDKKLAVIENEIGEVAVDDALLEEKAERSNQEEIILLDNGCVCCSIRADLVKALVKIAERHYGGLPLDGIVIELTGMADPAPVVQSFFMVEEVSNFFYIDNVVVLVDAKHILRQLEESQLESTYNSPVAAQVAFSSMVLLNKIDLVDESHLAEVDARIREISSTAHILRCQESRVPLSTLFNVNIFSLGRVLEEQYMNEDEFKTFYQPKMDRSISNVGIRCEGAVNLFAFQLLLDKYLDDEDSAKDFIRVKGLLEIAGSAKKYVVQCVHMVRTTGFSDAWDKGTRRENRIIFIGRGMQERRQALIAEFGNCMAIPLRFAIGEVVQVQVHGVGHCNDDHGHHDYESHDHGSHRHGHEHHHGCEGHSHRSEWIAGCVASHWDNQHAYRVQLHDGPEVHVPLDDERFIRK
mmetsp:Transcript_122954/g.244629  ORF Transcript_122954/g.244629 Transcript_122954/m.244629 type:complete len:461 (-) Transcript_122954:8-1390(-)